MEKTDNFKTILRMVGAMRSIAIIAIVAVMGFTVVSCGGGDNTDGNNGSNNGDNTGGNTVGTGEGFTLTNIPSEYNGKYAFFWAQNSSSTIILCGAQSVNGTADATLVQISNGSVSLPMWIMTSTGFTKYSGNDTVIGGAFIYNSPAVNVIEIEGGKNSLAKAGYESITFSNGKAAKSWSDATLVIDDKTTQDNNDNGSDDGNIYLKANRYTNSKGGQDENWGTAIQLSKYITGTIPVGSKMRISGTVDKECKNMVVSLRKVMSNGSEQWFGYGPQGSSHATSTFKISGTFNQEIVLYIDTNVDQTNGKIIMDFCNKIIEDHAQLGLFTSEDGSIPADISNGTTMATISNFSISIVQ